MKHQESLLQTAIVRYLRLNKVFCFAIPNGGQRSAITGAILKKEGVLAGVADLIVILPNKLFFIELKNGTRGRQSKSQEEFQMNVEKLGFTYEVWRRFEDCEYFLKKNRFFLNKNMI